MFVVVAVLKSRSRKSARYAAKASRTCRLSTVTCDSTAVS